MDGIKSFLQKDTAGLPNWVWGLIVAAGIAAAYFVPKLINPSGSSSSSASGSTDTSGQQGLGLAIDPTTGLPYAVEGLVPSGAGAGSNGGNSTPPPPPPPPTQTPPPSTTQKVTITQAMKQAYGGHLLHDLAAAYGLTYDQLYNANKTLLGPDKNHAKYKIGDVLTIPTSTSTTTTPVRPLGTQAQVSTVTPAWPGGTTQQRIA